MTSLNLSALELLQVSAPACNLNSRIGAPTITKDKLLLEAWLIQFRRLMSTNFKDTHILTQCTSKEALHAVAGLYDISLGDMETEIIYNSITDAKAATLVILRNESQAREFICSRFKKDAVRNSQKKNKDVENTNCATNENINLDETLQNVTKDDTDVEEDPLTSGIYDKVPEEDCLLEVPYTRSDFRFVYSDAESEEDNDESNEEDEEGEDEEEEEDFSVGYHSFIKSALIRKRNAKEHLEASAAANVDVLSASDVGPEHLLLGACTFEVKVIKCERIIHITFMAVRHSLRGQGLGSKLLSMVKDPTVVGQYQAVVVHADADAVEFFRKYGFTEDYVMNKKWAEIADQFTNCTLMTYLPPFSGIDRLADEGCMAELDLARMEREIQRWRGIVEDAHNAHFSLVQRLRQEVIHLRAHVTSQDDVIKHLMSELRSANQCNNCLENQLMRNKFEYLRCNDTVVEEEKNSSAIGQVEKEIDEKIVLQRYSQELEINLNTDPRFLVTTKSEVSEAKGEPLSSKKWCVSNVHGSKLTSSQKLYFQRYSLMSEFAEQPSIQLYYCGGQDHPEALLDILQRGFQEEDRREGKFGRGLYFSRFPATAALYAPTGQLLLADVLLGKIETVSAACRSRLSPSVGHHSVLCPGRTPTVLLDETEQFNMNSGNQPFSSRNAEYVIYFPGQAVPLALLEYNQLTDKCESRSS